MALNNSIEVCRGALIRSFQERSSFIPGYIPRASHCTIRPTLYLWRTERSVDLHYSVRSSHFYSWDTVAAFTAIYDQRAIRRILLGLRCNLRQRSSQFEITKSQQCFHVVGFQRVLVHGKCTRSTIFGEMHSKQMVGNVKLNNALNIVCIWRILWYTSFFI